MWLLTLIFATAPFNHTSFTHNTVIKCSESLFHWELGILTYYVSIVGCGAGNQTSMFSGGSESLEAKKKTKQNTKEREGAVGANKG